MSNEMSRRHEFTHPALKPLLEKYPNAHLLFPSQSYLENIGPMQKVAAEVIWIDGAPDSKEVYPIPGDRAECSCEKDPHHEKCVIWEQAVAFNAGTFERLGMAAGISYHPESGFTIDEPKRAAYKALLMMRKGDGSWSVEPFEKSANLDTLEKKFHHAYRKKVAKVSAHYGKKKWKWPGDEAWIDQQVERDLLQKEEYLRELVQTGAKKRAVQHKLGLRAHYKRRELAEPFIAIRIDFAPDLSDPQTKQLMIEQGTAAAGKIYPDPRPAGVEVRVVKPEDVPVPEGQDYDGLLTNGTEEDPRRERILEVEALEPDQKHALLVKLMKQIGYDLAKDVQGIGAMWHAGKKAEAIVDMEELVEEWSRNV